MRLIDPLQRNVLAVGVQSHGGDPPLGVDLEGVDIVGDFGKEIAVGLAE
jgi:hypothetical protein